MAFSGGKYRGIYVTITTSVVHLVNVNFKMILNLNALAYLGSKPKSPSEWYQVGGY